MIWKIFARLPSKWTDSEDYARECYRARVIAVGWSELGDLNSIPTRDKLREALARLWGRDAEHGAKTIGQWAGALWAFRNKVKKGDLVVCPDGDSGRYYVGVVLSKRVFHDTSTIGGRCKFAHRRKVKWIRPLNRKQIAAIWPTGQFGGNQTVSSVPNGEDRLRKLLKRKPRAFVTRPRLPIEPDMEWGKEAEARALIWLRRRGYSPKNESNLNKGWDISCGEDKFEVKGRKSPRTAIRLTQNEWWAAKKYRRRYAVLVFTAPTKTALKRAEPMQLVDPSNTETWTKRVVYEYVLAE